MKRCCRCRLEKQLSDFNRQKKRGHSGHCKDCNKAYCKDYAARKHLNDPEWVERERLRAQGYREDRSYRVVQMFHTVKCSARTRGLPFILLKSDIIALAEKQDWKCARTGIDLDLTAGQGTRPFGPSVDRIDNARGYEPGNIQIVCTIYNYAKNAFTDADVLTLATALTTVIK